MKNFLKDMVLDHGGTIFGGYLRDTIVGKLPHDMDVWFFSQENYDIFLKSLFACFKTLKIELCSSKQRSTEPHLPFSTCGYEKTDAIHWRIYLEDCEVQHLDVIISRETPISYKYQDCDINLLQFSKLFAKKELVLSKNSGLDIIKVLSNLFAGVFEPLPGCSEERLAKMLANGWAIKK